MYGNNSEVIDLLRRNPKSNGKVILERLRNKLTDLKEARDTTQKKVWTESVEKNFHRSLDHRSFYFKKDEKKLTNHKSIYKALTHPYTLTTSIDFYQDALQRYQNLQKSSPDQVVSYIFTG